MAPAHRPVLFALPHLLAAGGREQCIVDLAVALCRHGLDVRVFALWGATRDNPYLARLREAGVPLDLPGRAEVATARLMAPVPALAAAPAVRRLERTLDGMPGAVLHAHGGLQDLARFGQVAARAGMPIVATVHGAVRAREAQALGPRLAGLVRWSCHSRATATALRSALPAGADVRVILPIADSTAAAAPSITADWLRFGYVGRLAEGKELSALLRAFARVRLDGAAARLAVFGDGPSRRSLERQAAALGLGGAVSFRGAFPPDGLPAVLGEIDVLVHPSAREGLPHAVLDAMAAARPIAASAVGGIPDVLEDGVSALLVPPGDEPALAAALARLADDPGLRARLGTTARSAFEALPCSPAAVVEATLAMYAAAPARR